MSRYLLLSNGSLFIHNTKNEILLLSGTLNERNDSESKNFY